MIFVCDVLRPNNDLVLDWPVGKAMRADELCRLTAEQKVADLKNGIRSQRFSG